MVLEQIEQKRSDVWHHLSRKKKDLLQQQPTQIYSNDLPQLQAR